MGLDGFCFLIGLLIVPFSFLFFPKMYFKKELDLPSFIVALILGIIGLTVKPSNNVTIPNFNLFLLCPIFSLSLLKIGLAIFQKKFNRNPKYPPKNWLGEEDGLWPDRMFYFIFMLLSLPLPIFILAYFYR